jgi:hypothetical protein
MDQPPVPPSPKNDTPPTLSRTITVLFSIYGIIAVCILLGQNVPGTVGDSVRWLTLPMWGAGLGLGLAILYYGITIVGEKNRPMIVRVLSPLVGLAVGLVVFFGAIFFAITASLSNVTESEG